MLKYLISPLGTGSFSLHSVEHMLGSDLNGCVAGPGLSPIADQGSLRRKGKQSPTKQKQRRGKEHAPSTKQL